MVQKSLIRKKSKIKRGDTVIVLCGDDKGKRGEVLSVDLLDYTCIVSGVNIRKKHVKASADKSGEIVEKESVIHISNVSLLDSSTGLPTRVSFVFRDGKKVRVSKRSGDSI